MSQIDNLSREFVARPRPLDAGLSPHQRLLIKQSVAQLSEGSAPRFEAWCARAAIVCDIIGSSLGGLIIFALLLYMTLGWVLEDPLTGIQAFRSATQLATHPYATQQVRP